MTTEDHCEESHLVIDHAIDISSIPIPSQSNTSRRNNVLDCFYASTDEESSSNKTASSQLKDEIHNRVNNLTEFVLSSRRLLHQYPELMYQESVTSTIIQSILTKLGIHDYSIGWSKNIHQDVYPGPGGYGIVVDIGTGSSPCVLLRADMDGLPIQEQQPKVTTASSSAAAGDNEEKTSFPLDFVSRNEGRMHACGHDAHTAMLLGAAAILKDVEESIQGTVRLMFQPAEEGGAGAKRMIEEGLLTKEPKVERAFGIHVGPVIPSHTIASRPGPLMAASELFEACVTGVGGHASLPHLTVDPIIATSAIVMNLQSIVSRNLNPLESGVVSVTTFQAGEAFNVIPPTALIRGTIRALRTETLLALCERVEHVINATAGVYGCRSTIKYSPDYYPPTINDPSWYEEFSKEVGGMVSPEGYLREFGPILAGEDFSFVAKKVPSTFFALGSGSGTNPPTDKPPHHPKFALDESVLNTGVELHVNLALRALKRLAEVK